MFVLLAAWAWLVSACAAGPEQPVILLSDLQPLPDPARQDVRPLRVAVAAVISPQGTAESYQPLLDYVGTSLGRPVELVQRRTYAEINELIGRGEVDLAFVCTNAYVVGREAFGMRLLAAPQVRGVTVYYSLLIVPADSPAQDMADLRGKVFAFTDPMSNTGRLYPTYLVQRLGSTPEAFFSRIFFAYSHDDAIRAVAEGVADGAAVDSLVYEYATDRDSALGDRTRVIHRSPPFAVPPVVVGPAVRPQMAAALTEILLNMHQDPAGQAALDALNVDRFVEIEDSAYDSVRLLRAQVLEGTP